MKAASTACVSILRRKGGKAFTLVELLLVIAIMGILAAVTVPNLSRSIRGNRIRTATRTVVTASRYARNISILRDASHALVFDIDRRSIYLSEGLSELPEKTVEGFDADMEGTAYADAEEEEESVVFAAGRAFASRGEFERKLEGVVIESVEIRGEKIFTTGSAAAVFESNGRCTPYVVILTDETGKRVVIDVDALAATETEVFE